MMTGLERMSRARARLRSPSRRENGGLCDRIEGCSCGNPRVSVIVLKAAGGYEGGRMACVPSIEGDCVIVDVELQYIEDCDEAGEVTYRCTMVMKAASCGSLIVVLFWKWAQQLDEQCEGVEICRQYTRR
ncbi:hypothetical protein M0R45_002396 [Rubus argutus]|uniref:Uncharacterized protein n=1 Tax=Rubus argutus TaxID=59490 RepID=A0AAW1VS91_RUBAR